MSFSINIPGYNRAINVENEKDIFGNETYSSMVRTPFGEIVCIRTYIDEYDYSDLHHNLVWNTRIFMWGSIRDDSDRAFCPGPDEGVLARPRSVSEALGAIFSPFRACAVAMFPSRKHSNCRGMKWRWNKGKEAAALGFFLVQQPLFVDVPCEPHRIEIVR